MAARPVGARALTRVAAVSAGVLDYVARLPRASEIPAAPADGAALPRAPLLRWLVSLAATHALQTALFLGSFACIGYGALSGRLDLGWLTAWALALASTIPVQAYATWLEGRLVTGVGVALKTRLLLGALALDPEALRRKGVARLLSEALESNAIDEVGASGGIATLLASLDLIFALTVSLHAAASLLACVVLLLWSVVAGVGIAYSVRCQYHWSLQRLGLTRALVEKMSAHRTRLAQAREADRHAGDDAALAAYLESSATMDRQATRIAALLSSGYVIVGFATLAPSFVTGSASLSVLAVSVGAILFAADAFTRLSLGFNRTAGAWIAWRLLRPVLAAAVSGPSKAPAAHLASPTTAAPLVAGDLRFAHAAHPVAVLQGCDLVVAPGDQILLEGASGAGKSTLAALLAGLRPATGGYVLSGGLDRQTLGEVEWRRRVALVPQYHDNHIFAGPLLFNLLLARGLPHTAADIRDAAQICNELGLGPLLERMPSGLNQFVGDTGWRLSQGERSRIFLARALLQRSGIVILDETLAALDPENLHQCLQTVTRRAPTLVVIAHP